MIHSGQQTLLSSQSESLLRAALLRAARDGANLQDRLDCAELAQAAGHASLARLLYEIAFLRLGFGSDGLKTQASIVRETGLWDDIDGGRSRGPALAVSTIDLALSDLQLLKNALQACDHAASPDTSDAALRLEPSGGDSIAASLHALVKTLRCEQSEAVLRLPPILAQLNVELFDREPANPLEHVGADISLLGELTAWRDLKHLLRDVQDLSSPPLGSPDLFSAAARLNRNGLGPWLCNIGNIIRDGTDVLGLIAKLIPDEDWKSGTRTQWVARFATRLSESQLLELVDRVADLGLIQALDELFAASRRIDKLSRSYGCAQRFRDVGLDLHHWPLAIAGQENIVSIASHDPGELRVLADIMASSGDHEGARTVLLRHLSLDPANDGIAARLHAIADDDYSAFRVSSGLSNGSQKFARRAVRESLRAAESKALSE